jgi:hydrogenase nickel incorporation protein HypA/HybF
MRQERSEPHVHELGITQSIVEIADKTARDQGAQRVLSVSIEVGNLSGVVPDAVEFCYEACVQGTFLEGSRLIINRIEGLGRCDDCRAEFKLDNMTFDCPACGSYAVQRLQGEELNIKEVEIE